MTSICLYNHKYSSTIEIALTVSMIILRYSRLSNDFLPNKKQVAAKHTKSKGNYKIVLSCKVSSSKQVLV